MCSTPISASLVIRFDGSSFMYGNMGSILTITGIPRLVSASIAFKRFEGEGAAGSNSLVTFSSSVVIVKATVQAVVLSMSASRVTRSDFVMIWILQLLFERIWRHPRVRPVSASKAGYGSDELEIEIVSPRNCLASSARRFRRSFLGLASTK